MEITSNAPLRDPHEPVVPEGQLPAAHTEDHPAQTAPSDNVVSLLTDGLKQANERIAELERENIELKAAATVATTPLDEQLAEQPAEISEEDKADYRFAASQISTGDPLPQSEQAVPPPSDESTEASGS